MLTCKGFAVVALALICPAVGANAQNPDPLPGRLVGSYSVTVGGNKTRMGQVELTDVKVTREKVTGILATYRSPNDICFADKTPFDGSYQNGLLTIKSMPLVSQRPDSHPCAGIAIKVNVSAGRASGTYKAGPLEGLIELERLSFSPDVKAAPLWSTLGQDVADKPDLQLWDEWIFAQTGSDEGKAANRRWWRQIVEILADDKVRVLPRVNGVDVYDRSWNPRHPERPNFWALDFQFPLRVGAEWSYASPVGYFDAQGQTYDQRGHHKVVAMETISVGAGTFRCFRIEGVGSWISGSVYSADAKHVEQWLMTRWYCPDVKFIAKVHIERTILNTYDRGLYSELDSELVDFRPGKPVASISPPAASK
jgi:hypothetical protein